MESPSKAPASNPTTAPAASVATDVPKSALELLEEDDEFEEFEGTTWEDQAGAAEDGQLWQDDWEDDDVNDDFVQQLRTQIEARNGSAPAATSS